MAGAETIPKMLDTQYTLRPYHHLDFSSTGEVPESHAWSTSDVQALTVTETIPTLDLNDAGDPTFIPRLKEACESWGMFQLTGHGIPARLFELANTEARRFFGLPQEQKHRVLRTADNISGYGNALSSAFFDKRMWCESYTVLGNPEDNAKVLWPEEYHTWSNVMTEYRDELRKLAMRLMGLILASLEHSSLDDLEWPSLDGAAPILQLHSYPPCPNPEQAMGLAAHTDASLLNIVSQGDVSGLQIFRPEDADGPDRWINIPPMAGAVVVNIGDLFQLISNGRYNSILHRAVVNSTYQRVSTTYVHHPPIGAKLSPLKCLFGPEEGPVYKDVMWPEFLSLKLKYFTETLANLEVQKKLE